MNPFALFVTWIDALKTAFVRRARRRESFRRARIAAELRRQRQASAAWQAQVFDASDAARREAAKNGDSGVSDADPLPTPYPAAKTAEIAPREACKAMLDAANPPP